MPKDELNCEKLRQILEMERMEKIRKNRLLTEIEPDFYSNLMRYLNKLQTTFEEEYKVNPASPKTMLLRDELNKAKNLSEKVFEIREEKVVMATLSAIKGGKPDLKFMVNEEKMLYRHLLNILKENREQIFSTEPEIKPAHEKTFSNKSKESFGVDPTEKALPFPRNVRNVLHSVVATEFQQEFLAFSEKPKAFPENGKLNFPYNKTVPLNEHKPRPGYTVVRVMDNLSFVGSDEKEYNLTLNDVASLPIDTALLLCKTGKAEEIPIY